MSEMPKEIVDKEIVDKEIVDVVYPAPLPPAPPEGSELRRPPRRQEDEAAALVAKGGKDAEAKLKSERVEERLRAMPEWRLTLEDKAITRAKELPTSQVATLYSAYVTGLAAASNLPVCVNVAGGRVLVTLFARRNRGRFTNLTEAVLDLAERIS